MKIWNERAADHSAKLTIIGTFKTEQDARIAANKINGLLDMLKQELTIKKGCAYADEILQYMIDNNCNFTPQAIESASLHYDVINNKNVIKVETDDIEIQLFIEAFINNGGKIEISSRHNE